MRNLNGVETVYERKLKTVSLKRSRHHIADPEGGSPKAESPGEIHDILKAIYAQLDDDQEHLVLLVLNVHNEVTGFKVIASGSQSSGPGDAKIIFRNALLLGAAKIVLAHNHPSGALTPSKADIAFTRKIIEAGRVLDIPLIDHVIFTDHGYLSLRAGEYCEFEPFA